MQYKGFYKDNRRTEPLLVENDFKKMSFEIDGMIFISSSFEDWSLLNYHSYTKEQLSSFSFMESCNLLENGEKEKIFELCDCCIQVIIPQVIIEKATGKEYLIELKAIVELGKVRPQPKGGLEKSSLSLKFEFAQKEFAAVDCTDFEYGISLLLSELESKFYFKNCVSCLYGHCNAYGQPYLGGQQCFYKCKDEFLATVSKPYNPKTDLWHIEGKVDVQEIFCCKNFAKRIKET